MQLNLFSIDLTGKQTNLSTGNTVEVRLNGAVVGSFSANSSATADAATAVNYLTAQINAGAYQVNGSPVRASATDNVLHVLLVEDDAVAGPFLIKVGNYVQDIGDDSKWVKSVIEPNYTKPSATPDPAVYMLRSELGSKLVAAAAAGALAGNFVTRG